MSPSTDMTNIRQRFALLLALALCTTLHLRAEAAESAEDSDMLLSGDTMTGSNVHECIGKNSVDKPCTATVYLGETVVIKCPDGSTLDPTDWNTAKGNFCKEAYKGATPCKKGDKELWITSLIKVARIKSTPYYTVKIEERAMSFTAVMKAHVACSFSGGSDKNIVTMLFTPTRRPRLPGFLHTCNTFMPSCPSPIYKGDKVAFSCGAFNTVVPSDLLAEGGKYCEIDPDKDNSKCTQEKLWSDSFEVKAIGGDMKGLMLGATKDYEGSFNAKGLCVESAQKIILSLSVIAFERKDISNRPAGSVQCTPAQGAKWHHSDSPCKGPTAHTGVLVVDCTGFPSLYPESAGSLCSRPFKDDNDTCQDATIANLKNKLGIEWYAFGFDKKKAIDIIRVFSPAKSKEKKTYYGRCFNATSDMGIYFAVQVIPKNENDNGAAYSAMEFSRFVAVSLPALTFLLIGASL